MSWESRLVISSVLGKGLTARASGYRVSGLCGVVVGYGRLRAQLFPSFRTFSVLSVPRGFGVYPRSVDYAAATMTASLHEP